MRALKTLFSTFMLSLALASLPALAQNPLTVSFVTTPNGGGYAPKNVVAVWVQGPSGAFVKTIGRWSNARTSHLVAWNQASGTDADAVSGATRANHAATLTVPWDLKNKAGAVVPDGTYTIRMELADSNSSQASQNHQGTFTFVKGPTPSTQNTSGGGFNSVAITYTPPGGTTNQAPTVASPAAANPATTTGATATLSAAGADDNGEPALTYTWAKTSGAGTATFSVNGTNAAKQTVATFSAPGAYALTVTIADAGGLKVTSAVTVTVNAAATAIAITPASVVVPPSGTLAFSALAKDQFGGGMSPQPTFTWTVSGGGSISSAGLFTAGTTAGGPFTVTATSGGKSSTASVSIAAGAPPTVAQAPAAGSTGPVTGAAVDLTALGADSRGESTLTYTWSVLPTGPTFSGNGDNAAKHTKATFTQVGDYTFTVLVKNAAGFTASGTVAVKVVAGMVLAITPATPQVSMLATLQFELAATDQFGTAVTPTPVATWAATGAGTITSAGMFTAGNMPGMAKVQVSAGGASAEQTVTVVDPDPTASAPMATLLTPKDGAQLSGRALLRASAVGSGGIAKVAFRIDGTIVGEVTAFPYEWVVDTATLSNSTHVIDVQATDKSGRVALSAPSSVTVKNEAAGPTGCGATGATPELAAVLAALLLAGLRRRVPLS